MCANVLQMALFIVNLKPLANFPSAGFRFQFKSVQFVWHMSVPTKKCVQQRT